MSDISNEVDRRARDYMHEHGTNYHAAICAVPDEDRELRIAYLGS